MGLYDINLKRTVIGYQFDHNVYIGNQTNENRVVTFKELGNVINSVSSGGGSGSVTSVALTAPTGFTVSGSPVTGAGTLALNFDTGYSLPTTAKQAEWDSKATKSWVDNAGHVFSSSISFSRSPGIEKHLVIYGDDETDADKPANNTGLTGDINTKYWNTGISTYDRDNEVGYQYSFPAHSGTFVTTAGGTMDNDAVVGFKSANDNDTAHIDSDGFTAATRTGRTSSNWSSMATTYAYNAINIESKGKRTGPNHQVTEWDNVYKLNLPLKGRIVEDGDTGATLLTDESLKTINGISLVGSGDIVIDTDPSESRQFTTKGYNKVLNDLTHRYPQDDSVLASDMNLLANLEVANNHFGLAICKPSFRTLNPDRNGKQERKGWFLEPNICKRGKFNITGFSTEADNYVTSFSFQDLFNYFPIKDGDSELNIVPTLHAVVYPLNIDGSDIVFTLPNTATYTQLQIDATSWSVRDVSLISAGKSRMSPWAMFNLLIGHFGCRYIDTSSFSDRHGYHPRCTWLYAFRVFMLLKRPENTGDNWQLIVHFSTAK